MLSSLAPYLVYIEGKMWHTSEHYFQVMKYIKDRPEYATIVENSAEPMKLGEETNGVREGWEAIKNEVMFNAIRAKFTQHSDLAKDLLGTGNKDLRLAPKRTDGIMMNGVLMDVRKYISQNEFPIRPQRETYEDYARDSQGMLIIKFV